jgi:hypothetical protein
VKTAERLDQSATILSLEAIVLAIAGLKDEARQVVQRVEDLASKQHFCPDEVGAAYVSLGDGDTAYRWFRPRYASLLREIG